MGLETNFQSSHEIGMVLVYLTLLNSHLKLHIRLLAIIYERISRLK